MLLHQQLDALTRETIRAGDGLLEVKRCPGALWAPLFDWPPGGRKARGSPFRGNEPILNFGFKPTLGYSKSGTLPRGLQSQVESEGHARSERDMVVLCAEFGLSQSRQLVRVLCGVVGIFFVFM